MLGSPVILDLVALPTPAYLPRPLSHIQGSTGRAGRGWGINIRCKDCWLHFVLTILSSETCISLSFPKCHTRMTAIPAGRIQLGLECLQNLRH